MAASEKNEHAADGDLNGVASASGQRQDGTQDDTPNAPSADGSVIDVEKIERNGKHHISDTEQSPNKRVKSQNGAEPADESQPGREKGVAPIKKEYLVHVTPGTKSHAPDVDDDAAEAGGSHGNSTPAAGQGGVKTKRGQNKARDFGSSRDAIQLCNTRALTNEFSPKECRFGDKCRLEHDLRKYLREGKRADLNESSGGDSNAAFAEEETKPMFGGVCPIWEERGTCSAGWKCRFASSHSAEIKNADGRDELVLVNKPWYAPADGEKDPETYEGEGNYKVFNTVSSADRIRLEKNKWRPFTKSEKYSNWLEQEEHRASYKEPPFRPSEKRKLYYGPETPVLAPLTTQGNLPFRRLCVSLGAQLTWSEMVRGYELIRGEKRDWPLVKAHEDEMRPPNFFPAEGIVRGYDNGSDIRFGAQLAANKSLLALKATEVLTELCPRLRAIDLNCGCPTADVTKVGAGSALLGKPGRIENILRGMNAVSGPVPVTVKIRMGVETGKPNADRLCQRLVLGGPDPKGEHEGAPGVAAITLHGRSQQQRYTRSADWEYIASCATLIRGLKARHADATDTIREPDPRDLAPTPSGIPYFCGNGDVLSHVDYNAHIESAGVDAVMVGRGALVKPWIFEEIAADQYLDKSASERLAYVETFVKNGLAYWGADEFGVGTTRKFLLEWLSFACRYVPVGLLEYLPPKLGDRPPAFKGRSELETLMASGNYKDWIKISEWFLGPAHKDFVFQPKHKSNSYEIETNG